MVTIGTNQPQPSDSGPNLESLTHIDITKLSQSELHSLSLCSSSSFDLRRTHDLVIPNIDRSLFNHSAGSRRQTFSRPRSSAASRRPRLANLLPHSPKPPPSSNDPHLSENKSILNFLKKLIGDDQNSNSPTNQMVVVYDQAQAVPETVHEEMEIVVHSGEGKRKRGRKPKGKVEENGSGIELEVVNKNGVAVDLAALSNSNEDGFYGSELRSRTVGLESEEEVLGFLRGLEGQWCSRRKKRKIVDASMFGDALPVGWKLVLGLKRRDGRVSVYCRRYMRWSSSEFYFLDLVCFCLCRCHFEL